MYVEIEFVEKQLIRTGEEIKSTNLLLVCPGWLATQCTLTFKASFEEEDHGPVYLHL